MAKRGNIKININDVIGKRLGKLQVVSYAGYYYDDTSGGERLRHHYVVKCDCGTIKVIRRGQITSGIIHSCGCSRKRR